MDNPIRFIDPDGMRVAPASKYNLGYQNYLSGLADPNGWNAEFSQLGLGGGGDGDAGDDGYSESGNSGATYANYWSTLVSYLMGGDDGGSWNSSDELIGDGTEVSDQSLTAESDPAPTISLEKGSIGPFTFTVYKRWFASSWSACAL